MIGIDGQTMYQDLILDKYSISKASNSQELFKIKHIGVISEESFVIFALHKQTLDHVILQTVLSTQKDEILQKITKDPLIKSDFILQLVQETISEENSPITWLIYENSFCTIEEYITMTRYSSKSPGIYFSQHFQSPCLEEIYSIDSKIWSFDLKNSALQLIILLFEIVEHLNHIGHNELFSTRNILISDSGRLKIFPVQERFPQSSPNKDVEDVAVDLLATVDDLNCFGDYFKTIDISNCENVDYLRNIFAAGLISVRLIFRDWSPFRFTDLPDQILEQLNIQETDDVNINQDIWLIRSIFDPAVSEEYIQNGWNLVCSLEDKNIQVLMRSFHNIFQPRSQRQNIIDNISSLKDNSYLEDLSHFLRNYYEALLSNNRNNNVEDNFNNDDYGCNVKSKEVESCSPQVKTENYEGISNWIEDSQSFFFLGEKKQCADCPALTSHYVSDNTENFAATLDVSEGYNAETQDRSTVFNFDVSSNQTACSDDNTDKVFPIFKTFQNDVYVKYMSQKAKRIKLRMKNTPKPVITCYPKGVCTLHYDYDQFVMTLEQIPLKYIKENIEGNQSNLQSFEDNYESNYVFQNEESDFSSDDFTQ